MGTARNRQHDLADGEGLRSILAVAWAERHAMGVDGIQRRPHLSSVGATAQVLHIAADIARGLAYLHPTIIHRDLKPGNVLLSHVDRIRPLAKLTVRGACRILCDRSGLQGQESLPFRPV